MWWAAAGLAMRRRLRKVVIGSLVAGALAADGNCQPAYIIDTHVHADPRQNLQDAIAAAISTMNRFGIDRIILMSPPQIKGRPNLYDVDQLRFAGQKFPNRISIAGGGGSLNTILQATPANSVSQGALQQFRAMAIRLLDAGAISFG